jgi:cysteinyl-tRNA synthetase
MNIKFLSILSLFIIFFSCKKNEENTVVDTKKESQELTEKDILKIKYIDYILDDRTEAIASNWNEYTQIQDVITNVKKADLSFFNNNKKNIKELLENFKENIPTELNTPAIMARILAFETKLYKLESLSNLSTTSKKELLNVIKEFFISFSNLNLQMNKKIEGDNIIIEKP